MRFQRLMMILPTAFLLENSRAFGNDLAEEAARRYEQELPQLRLSVNDFKLSAGWDLPLTIPKVENLFGNPLQLPTSGSKWADEIENAKTYHALFSVAAALLGTPTAPEPVHPITISPKVLRRIPVELRVPVGTLVSAIATAQPMLQSAVDSVSAKTRRDFLGLCEWPLQEPGSAAHEISSQRTKNVYAAMAPFSQDRLLAAGNILFQALDEAIPQIKRGCQPFRKKIRLKTAAGIILIGGPQDDHYWDTDLRDVSLFIDLGGNNTYQTPLAAAFENEIRIAIDLGDDVNVHGEKFRYGSAGIGAFGIGILALPNAAGVNTITSGSFSQGCGVAGIGALLINGTSKLRAERNAQGHGIFGVGLLSTENSPKSVFVAKRSAQGFGQVRGVGLFRHEGDEADIQGGLVQPDPREPQGSVSMCQGVGFGDRAYSGGGIGLAVLRGNRMSVKGSYFSQGAGYWHALGGFRIRGSSNTVQARRYTMGSGVHSAFGHFELIGNHNRVLNWGVGPAYGWDRSVGSAIVAGDHNEVQVDWGAGVGNIGSLSMGTYKGDHGRYKLCDFGRGQFFRNESSYSLQILDGEDTKTGCLGDSSPDLDPRRLFRNPRGLVLLRGVALVDNLNLDPAVWPELPQDQATQEARVDLQAIVKQSKTKPVLDELADLVDVAAAFSLDKKTPREALTLLLSLPDEKATLLPDLVEPAAIDQLIQLSIVLPAHGDIVAGSALLKRPTYTVQKQAVLINFLRLFRPSVVFPGLLPVLQSSDHRLRAATLRTLGYMLNKDVGQEPGLRSALEALSSSDDKTATELLKKLVLSDAFALLSIGNEKNSARDRIHLLKDGPADITSKIDEKGAETLLKIIRSNGPRNHQRILSELNSLTEMEPQVRKASVEILTSTQTSDLTAGLLALGQIANSEDLDAVTPFFRHESASVREAAAVAVGRMGDAAIPFLSRVLDKGTSLEKCLAMVTLQQSVSRRMLPLLKRGLNDTSTSVRLTAIGVVNELSEPLTAEKENILKMVQARLRVEKNKQVRMGLRLATNSLK